MQPAALTAQDRATILDIFSAALRAVDPSRAVRTALSRTGETLSVGGYDYRLDDLDRIIVVGAGKAGAPMAAAVNEIVGGRIAAGAVTVKYGHDAAAGGWRLRFGRGGEPGAVADRAETGPIAIAEAGHPVPDAAGLAGAERMAAALTGLTERDLVIVLLSGGGSALLPLPAPGIALADYRALTALLLRCGADITEINTVRKHCSRLQGGQLARLAAPARVVALILSDVVGAPLDAIASGPTAPDPSTFADAWGVLARHGLTEEIPESVRAHLAAGVRGELPDTPKPGDPLFERVHNIIIGDNAIAGRAAVSQAARHGLNSLLLTTFIQGEAREVGRALAGLTQGVAWGQSDCAAPACLILGGETTVTVRGRGVGGRNQELALAAALALDVQPLPPGIRVAVASLGTDGSDGPTDAAGGLAAADTLARARRLGLDARAALADNDSYHLLGALGDLILSGPTQTNVNDLMGVFAFV